MASRSSSVTSVTLAAFFLTCACHGADAQTTSVGQSPDTVSTGPRMVIVPIEPALGSSVPIARFRVTIENDGAELDRQSWVYVWKRAGHAAHVARTDPH